jgi:hypothetical protein
MTILYEVHDIERLPSVQDFASYSRLTKRRYSRREESGPQRSTATWTASPSSIVGWMPGSPRALIGRSLPLPLQPDRSLGSAPPRDGAG